MSDTTMRRIAEEDLRFELHMIRVRQMLFETAKMNRELFAIICFCIRWSPDLNSMDYVWSVIERMTNK